jgi:hypothetical protein
VGVRSDDGTNVCQELVSLIIPQGTERVSRLKILRTTANKKNYEYKIINISKFTFIDDCVSDLDLPD